MSIDFCFYSNIFRLFFGIFGVLAEKVKNMIEQFHKEYLDTVNIQCCHSKEKSVIRK